MVGKKGLADHRHHPAVRGTPCCFLVHQARRGLALGRCTSRQVLFDGQSSYDYSCLSVSCLRSTGEYCHTLLVMLILTKRQRVGYLRRPYPAKSKLLGRKCLCKEIWRFFAMLGRHLVAHLPVSHDLWHFGWPCCLQTGF